MSDSIFTAAQKSSGTSESRHTTIPTISWHNDHTYSKNPELRSLAEKQTRERLDLYAEYVRTHKITDAVIKGAHHTNPPKDPKNHWTVELRNADGKKFEQPWHIYFPEVDHPFRGPPAPPTPTPTPTHAPPTPAHLQAQSANSAFAQPKPARQQTQSSKSAQTTPGQP